MYEKVKINIMQLCIFLFGTLTEVFPCFFLSCKANARVQLANTGHTLHSSKLVVIRDVIYVVICIVYV